VPSNDTAVFVRRFYFGTGPLCCFRTIFLGSTNNIGGVPAATTTGQLNLAPMGLGTLAACNYIGDVSTFYCPSAAAGMPAPGDNPDTDSNFWCDQVRNAVTSISDLKRSTAGGMDALSIMRGNYNWLSALGGYQSSAPCTNAVLSHYAYRDVPFDVCPAYAEAYPASDSCTRIDYVSPALTFTVRDWTGPLFRTQKILAGRALVADAFGKNRSEWTTQPGPGYFAHRDGYNVLYGDWSAKWWGDPQQRFIWWPSMNNVGYAIYGGDTNVVTDFESGTTIAGAIADAGDSESDNGAVIQWHSLDVAAGWDDVPNP
jgi:hypothetical protein